MIYWQYAKLIADSAGFGKTNYRFIMSRFTKLKKGEIKWSTSIREWLREHDQGDVCGYCGKEAENLTTEHILPRSRGGIDHPDNAIRVCKACNLKKSSKRLYEYFTLGGRDDVPRIAEGKYLKMLYKLHEDAGTLDVDTVTELCEECDMDKLCEDAGTAGKLSVYCLEGIFTKR
ncbi:MAG: HNH endonuclease [Promethearchaeota archaeon]